MGSLPINLVASAITNEAARVEAVVNKGVPFHDPRITKNHPRFDPKLFSEVDEERKRIVREWVKDPAHESNLTLAAMTAVHVIIDANRDEAWQPVQAVLSAMLMQLWTAFESLAQDTWIVSVNSKPNPLAKRILKSGRDLATGAQIKSIPANQIVGFDFDLRRSMGTVLVRQRAVDFQQLKTIRNAYKIAFDGHLSGSSNSTKRSSAGSKPCEIFLHIKAASLTINSRAECATMVNTNPKIYAPVI